MRRTLFSCSLIGALMSLTAAAVTAGEVSHSSISREANVVRAVGVVRYFYPHDSVTEVDWNRLILEGFRLADSESDDGDFARDLATLLGQLGGGIVHRSGADSSPLPPLTDCPQEATPVRWVHEGIGVYPAFGNRGPYRSWRSGVIQPEPSAFSTAMKDLPAGDWHGQGLIFSSEVRLPDGGEAALWVRIRDAERNALHFENMDQRRIDDTEWASHSLHFEVPENADRLAFGLLTHGPALAEFRSVRLQSVDESTGSAVGESLLPEPEQWQLHSTGTAHALQVDIDDQGARVRLEPAKADVERPPPGPESLVDAPTTTTVPLLDGSQLHVPMLLCPQQAALAAVDRKQLVADFPVLDIESLSPTDKARLDVAVLWPVLQHFYPYRDRIDRWVDALDTALAETRSVETINDHERLLRRLMFHLNDGHVAVYHVDDDPDSGIGWLPIAVESVDGELIVSRVIDSGMAQPGDRIISVDGEPVSRWLAEALAHHSGSLAWRTHRVIGELLRGPQGEMLALELLRDDQRLQFNLAFEQSRQLETLDHPPAATLDGGIVYVNLHGMAAEAQAELVPKLLQAPGVILDLRGYPRDHTIVSHLLTEPDHWQGWMRVMLARAPDGDLGVESEYQWSMQPVESRIESPVVLLTNHRALSYSESITGMIKRHELATVVGSNTGGANGNILPLQLPSGFLTRYTGMHVLGPDGDPYHAIGIEPDIRVAPSIEGLKEGRDEVLERAMQLFE